MSIPSSIWRRNSNPQPLKHESSPITTITGLPSNWYLQFRLTIPFSLNRRLLQQQQHHMFESVQIISTPFPDSTPRSCYYKFNLACAFVFLARVGLYFIRCQAPFSAKGLRRRGRRRCISDSTTSSQCDQIWPNFATLANFKNIWPFLTGVFRNWHVQHTLANL